MNLIFVIWYSLLVIFCTTIFIYFSKGAVASNGYHGCLKCEAVGKYSYTGNKVIFTKLDAPKRTDEKFRSGEYSVPSDDRRDFHCKNTTVLTKLPINIIEDVIIGDSLHLIDLGKFKALVQINLFEVILTNIELFFRHHETYADRIQIRKPEQPQIFSKNANCQVKLIGPCEV